MAVIAPNTDLVLLKVPLEMDETNQLTFASATAQYNYFYSLPKKIYDNFTYQRKDNTIRIPEQMDDIITYNYVMYRNTSYSNKWFYAFITDMEYVNDNVTSVSIKTDVWQTWQFALTYKPVLIDREHTNDDTVGSNLLPENLELGELVTNGGTTDFGAGTGEFDEYWTIIDVSMIENEGENATLDYNKDTYNWPVHPKVHGIPSGVYHLVVGRFSTTEEETVKHVIDVYDTAGLGDAILNIYVMPKACVGTVHYGLELTAHMKKDSIRPYGSVEKWTYATVGTLAESLAPETAVTKTITRPTTLNSYTPVNQKLFTFPYCYFNISNNAGNTVPFHYEDFDSTIQFDVISAVSPSGSVKALPVNYKHIGSGQSAFDFGVNGAKYPMCAWINDSFTNWLTQNAVNAEYELKKTLWGGLGAVVTGASSAAVLGGIGGGVLGAAGGALVAGKNLIDMARREHVAQSEANLVPDQAKGNVNCGDLLWSFNRSRFTYMPMCVKPEIAQCIDQYFSQFGYKCNKVKLPNITGRRNWNYVKTVGCYIDADIPQSDLQEIKDMFDRGVTFWHNPATFADYSQTNDILT